MSESYEELRGRVLDPDDLVAYQTGAVVSRTLVKNAAGTLTLFAFAEGEGLSEHTAPFDAVVSVLDGEAELTIGGAAHRVESGWMIILPAGVSHALHARRPFRMLLAMIREG